MIAYMALRINSRNELEVLDIDKSQQKMNRLIEPSEISKVFEYNTKDQQPCIQAITNWLCGYGIPIEEVRDTLRQLGDAMFKN